MTFLCINQFRLVGLRFMCWLYDRKTQRLTESVFLWRSWELNLRPLVHKANKFVAFLGINQFRRVGLRFVCWFYVGNTQRLTEKWFYGEAGNKPVTPGLQGIGLFLTSRQLLWFTTHMLIPCAKKTLCGFPRYKPVLPRLV